MFSHVVVGSNDLEKAKNFYDAIFAAMGATSGVQMGEYLIYSHNDKKFLVAKPINGEPACFANGGTIGFTMENEEMANAWHHAGVVNGGTTCEDPPGVRELGPNYKMYLAYLRDPDGNKLCALKMLS